MIVIGLTGSIGMGKSTVAQMFTEEGAPAFNSDDAVHALYAQGGAAVAPVEAVFPGVIKGGAIDRRALSARVVDHPEAIKQLEAIVHPLVRQAQAEFLEAHRGAAHVDKIVVVSAPPEVQRARVMTRPGMTEEKFAYLLSRQMPDADKRARADFVIDTSGELDATRTQVRAVLDALGEQG